MDWDKLRVFYQVAQCSSVSHAALKMNISQPAISRSIQALEYQLGVTLFNRVPRGIVLTSQGEILKRTVEDMFFALERGRGLMGEESKDPCGPLKVATTVALASVWLVSYMPEFLALYPKIEMDIIGHDEKLDMKARQADVSIRPYSETEKDLISQYLFSCTLQLYASPEYIKNFGEPKTAEDLDHHRLIAFGESIIKPYSEIDWALTIGCKKGDVRRPYISINSSQGAINLAEQGIGIIALSKEFPYLKNLNLVRVLPDVTGPIVDLFYVYPEALQNSKRIKVFGEFLKKRIPKEWRRF